MIQVISVAVSGTPAMTALTTRAEVMVLPFAGFRFGGMPWGAVAPNCQYGYINN